MTTEDRLDEQGLKIADKPEELSQEEKETQEIEAKLSDMSEPQSEPSSEQTGKNSEQSAGEEATKTGEPSEDDDLPKGAGEDSRNAFIKQRQKFKSRIAELEAELTRAKESPAVSPEPAPAKQEQAPVASAEQVMDLYVRAINDDLTSEETERLPKSQVIKLAEMAMAKQLPSSELYKVIQKAIESESPYKDDIVDIGNKYLNIAKFREEEEATSRATERDAMAGKHQTELKQVVEKYPDIAKEDSPLGKFARQWDEAMLGKVVEGKRLAGELSDDMSNYLASHPIEHAKMIVNAFSLNQSPVNKKAIIEGAVKKKLLLDSAEGSTPSVAQRGKQERNEADILSELERMSSSS